MEGECRHDVEVDLGGVRVGELGVVGVGVKLERVWV